jgi:hypothetical protein
MTTVASLGTSFSRRRRRGQLLLLRSLDLFFFSATLEDHGSVSSDPIAPGQAGAPVRVHKLVAELGRKVVVLVQKVLGGCLARFVGPVEGDGVDLLLQRLHEFDGLIR